MEPVTETEHAHCETDHKGPLKQDLITRGIHNEKQNKKLYKECDLHTPHHTITQEKNEIKERFQEKDHVIKIMDEELFQCILKEMEEKERSLEERLSEVMREMETKSIEQKKIHREYIRLWFKLEEALSCLADAKYQEKKALETNAELRYNNSILIEQREALHGSAKNLSKFLYNQHNMPMKETKSTLLSQNGELRNQVGILQNKVKNLEERLETRRNGDEELVAQRQSQKEFSILWVKYKDALSTLADAEERERKALEDNAVLRHCNSVLRNQREVLQDSVDHLQELFYQERKMHIKSVKSTLQNENHSLRKQIRLLQTKVNMIEEEIKTHKKGKEEPMEQSQTDYFTLWKKYEEVVAKLADAEDQETMALEANTELEHSNSILVEQREAFQTSLDHLQELFAQQRKTRAKLLESTLENANAALRKQVRILQTKVNMMEEQLKISGTSAEEAMEQEESQEDYYTLWIKYEEVVAYLADAEDKERKTLEDNAELEHYNSILIEQREALQSSANQLPTLFSGLRKTGVKLTKSTLQNENKVLRKHVQILQTKMEKLEQQVEIRKRGKDELMYWLANLQDFMAKRTAVKTPTRETHRD